MAYKYILIDGRCLTVPHETTEVLQLLSQPQPDPRQLHGLGLQILATGNSEALKTAIDLVFDRLGSTTGTVLVDSWKPILGGGKA